MSQVSVGLRLVAAVAELPLADPSKPHDEAGCRPEHRRPCWDQYRAGPRIELSIFDCVQPPEIRSLITQRNSSKEFFLVSHTLNS